MRINASYLLYEFCQPRTYKKHGGPEMDGPKALLESKQGALEEAGVMRALRQSVEDSFDLVRLFQVLSSVFF